MTSVRVRQPNARDNSSSIGERRPTENRFGHTLRRDHWFDSRSIQFPGIRRAALQTVHAAGGKSVPRGKTFSSSRRVDVFLRTRPIIREWINIFNSFIDLPRTTSSALLHTYSFPFKPPSPLTPSIP